MELTTWDTSSMSGGVGDLPVDGRWIWDCLELNTLGRSKEVQSLRLKDSSYGLVLLGVNLPVTKVLFVLFKAILKPRMSKFSIKMLIS